MHELYNTQYTASGAKKSANLLWNALNNMGESKFDELWEKTRLQAEPLGLKMPEQKRQRIPPRRYEYSETSAAPAVLDAKTTYRKDFIAILDLLKSEIERRFQQKGMDRLIQLENLLVADDEHQPLGEKLTNVLDIHACDFDIRRLEAQLLMLPTVKDDVVTAPPAVNTVTAIAELLSKSPPTTRKLLDQVERLVALLLSVPATSATGERSFSALRRLKTYMRSTMTQARLAHLLLLHVHGDSTAKI